MPTTTRRIRRLSKPLCIALAAGWFSVSCGDSPTRPSQDPVQAPAGTDPVARLTVTIDSLGSREAVAALSNVTLDATGSTGGPTIAIDFGDGTRVTQAVARHVYADAGTYTATVTVTDGSGKTSTASHQVVVASPLGTWLYSGYLTRARRVEVRTLALTTQAERQRRARFIEHFKRLSLASAQPSIGLVRPDGGRPRYRGRRSRGTRLSPGTHGRRPPAYRSSARRCGCPVLTPAHNPYADARLTDCRSVLG